MLLIMKNIKNIYLDTLLNISDRSIVLPNFEPDEIKKGTKRSQHSDINYASFEFDSEHADYCFFIAILSIRQAVIILSSP